MSFIRHITDLLRRWRHRDELTSLRKEIDAIELERALKHRRETIPQSIVHVRDLIAREEEFCWSLICRHNPVPGAPCFDFALYYGYCFEHRHEATEYRTEYDSALSAA